MLTDFQNSAADTLTSKHVINLLLNISPPLKGVATLPCEISLFKKLFFFQGLNAANCHIRLSHFRKVI